MAGVSRLCPAEVVHLDAGHMNYLKREMGAFAAEHLRAHALETIATRLGTIEAAWSSGEFARLGACAASLAELAGQVGMTGVAAVSRHTETLSGGRDEVALAAVVDRLVRVGEASLAEFCNVGYLRP